MNLWRVRDAALPPRPFRISAVLLAAVGLALLVRPDSTELLAAPMGPPALITLEGHGESGSTRVVERRPDASVEWTSLSHAPGAARRGALLPTALGLVALVVVDVAPPLASDGYSGALYLARPGGSEFLLGGLVHASTPLVTGSGDVVIARGRAGAPPPTSPWALRERIDALTLERVDLRTHEANVLWRGAGLIALPVAATGAHRLVAFHLRERGAELFELDAESGATRSLGEVSPLSRDWSWSHTTDEVVFSQPNGDFFEIVALPLHGDARAPRVLWRAESDRLMPRVSRDGTVWFSHRTRGLMSLRGAEAQPRAIAPLGNGTDALLSISLDLRSLVVRHTTPAQDAQFHAVVSLHGAPPWRLPDETVLEVLGFAEAPR